MLEVYDDPIDVPGVPEKTSKAVTLRTTFERGGNEESLTDTVHAIPIEGRWVWILAPADVRAYERGECPA